MNTVSNRFRMMVTGTMLAVALGGCSDQSRMRLVINSILGDLGDNSGKPYLEVDLMGNFSNAHCATIQDTVTVSVSVQSPGSLTGATLSSQNLVGGAVGPTLSGAITGYRLDYYYYDPNDGTLHGPVQGLSLTSPNMYQRLPANAGSTAVILALATFNLKAWCSRATCQGAAGFPGPGYVSRVIGRITMYGEDESGKKLSTQGDMMIYLYDYGPGPAAPINGVLVAGDECWGTTLSSYWDGFCR